MKNTALSYLYRDADNFKQSKVVILEGELAEGMLERIISSAKDDGDQSGNPGYFIPGQVGLPDLQNQFGRKCSIFSSRMA